MSTVTPSAANAGAASKPARIELKTSPEVKELLERAAAINGINLTAFIINNVREKALAIVESETTLNLNQRAWAQFETILDNPRKATPVLKTLFSEK
ncbi:DUF1778 domain-containing protein [Shewanella oneidensis]|uniref:Toxin-antitoxin system antidote Rhh family n=1 Tax=Shewanella oneidensis (strain ATCC 700550 / JCM 31522 / CIP 106686 / LMG 19005 / NCIMB 14063 / MR-1) TaxID=211586 RepID=Q8E866_SHEON|nr:DUF1778 domain-containing protein [Shewanella oneidensis]AAN52995.1 toxin-antitoxin system antidote Rhh family [Shewanella oneidensis MR-1]MDX5999760.1 DUF1778 domain-containing protein [Shewanella oneidensis]MEE2030372.1 hypothetical protein [Shewanella oneidensis]